MDHSLGEFNRTHVAGKFTQCLPVLLYRLILGSFQPAIGNKGPNELQFTSVKPNSMMFAFVDYDPGYFREILSVH